MRSRNLRSALTSVGSIFALATLISLTAPASAAQSTIQSPECKGVIHGIVSDQQGQPVPGMKVEAWPLGVDLGVMLPEATTNQAGEYRFDHLCRGRYTVLPDDVKAGYPDTFEFLTGRRLLEAKLTNKIHTAEIPVQLPLKAGTIYLRVKNRATDADIKAFTIEIAIPDQPRPNKVRYLFDGLMQQGDGIAVPSDRGFTLRVTAPGFRKWIATLSGRKLLRVGSGQEQSIEAQLFPVHTK
jgi:hypothetical protein